MDLPEPWLRGPLNGVHTVVAAALRALEQAGEDLARHTAGLSADQIWAQPHGLTPLGFHLRHIAGSIDRLSTYLRGEQLSDAQLDWLRAEAEPGMNRDELLRSVEDALERAAALLRTVDPGALGEPRQVGRQRLPTTVAGLVVHIAEHTQRHVGQAIAAAKLVRALGAPQAARIH